MGLPLRASTPAGIHYDLSNQQKHQVTESNMRPVSAKVAAICRLLYTVTLFSPHSLRQRPNTTVTRAANAVRAQTSLPGKRPKRRVRSGSLPDIAPVTPTDDILVFDEQETKMARLARENEELRQEPTLPPCAKEVGSYVDVAAAAGGASTTSRR